MASTQWKPWHKVVQLRDDLRSGELTLSMFAANLHDVAFRKSDSVGAIYADTTEFFALTYPTFNMRDLARDVALRLAGKSDKAIRQLALTYGGGKTHSLITFYHLFSAAQSLPDLPAVAEFINHMNIARPRARVAVLPFDYLDPVTGMDVIAPDGSTRRFKYPWSVLAYQLGGEEGLAILGGGTEANPAEREEPPFTNVLEDLFRLPSRQNLATLVLMDEVLMWARTKIGAGEFWRARIQDFFQCLSQASINVKTCAVVVSLLASDPRKNDEEGKRIASELSAVLQRQQEESVQPVVKDDVAEVLRRRLLTPDSIRDRDAFRPHVVAALKGMTDLDEQTRKEGKAAEERYLRSYPFHPDLTDLFYSKWINLENFQRTRGVLRTYALALRDAEKWDDAPLIATNTFLGPINNTSLSEAARELAGIAMTAGYDGAQQAWSNIIEGELAKAKQIQQEFTGLSHREIEQAVFATFLHSQPVGLNSKAQTRELLLLVGHTRPDKINLEQGLLRWAELSWFLDEEALGTIASTPGALRTLPGTWRLGLKPNLTQMHHEACKAVDSEVAQERLITEINKVKSLTANVRDAGATPHLLPDHPSKVDDDGEFRFVLLNPSAASEASRPSAEARRFLEQTTGPDKPRVNKNAVVLVAPSATGLDVVRNAIREVIGWEDVQKQIKDLHIEPFRVDKLAVNMDKARRAIPDAIKQAYSIVIALSEKNEVQAFKIAVDDKSLFASVKADPRARIQEKAVSADALLPEGPYNLWREGESTRRVKDLVGAFAQFAHLPKMLNRKAILDTLVQGCKDGMFVLRQTRPDRSYKTYWRQPLDETALKDPSLEVVLPENAELTELPSGLLLPQTMPGLWQSTNLTFKEICTYFRGGHVVKKQGQGYEEPVIIPRVERELLIDAVNTAVRAGRLWLTVGPASIWSESIPTGLLTDDAQLQAPPDPIPATDIIASSLPDAWRESTTTALTIAAVLSQKAGKNLPWAVVREAIDGALRSRWLELTIDSGAWPCEYPGAQLVKLRMVTQSSAPTPTITVKETPKAQSGTLFTEADLQPNEIQDLADQIGEIKKIAVGLDVRFHLRIELSSDSKPNADTIAQINEILREVSDKLMLK